MTSTFPPVATVLGISKDIAESGPLLATLALDPSLLTPPAPPPVVKQEAVEIKAGDPVTQAVVDNIIGKLPTKKEPVQLRCEVCDIFVSREDVMAAHLAGAKHARKLKGREMVQEVAKDPESPFIVTVTVENTMSQARECTCKICNVRVNSYEQLQQHVAGSKHKRKTEQGESNTMKVPVTKDAKENKGAASVDIGPNRLYCAACNVQVNSDLQLHQHITSSKHTLKVNGRTNNKRDIPYARPPGRGGRGGYAAKKKKNVNTGWTASSNSMGLWPQKTVPPPSNTFVSGGTVSMPPDTSFVPSGAAPSQPDRYHEPENFAPNPEDW